jgi:hypothetical protein
MRADWPSELTAPPGEETPHNLHHRNSSRSKLLSLLGVGKRAISTSRVRPWGMGVGTGSQLAAGTRGTWAHRLPSCSRGPLTSPHGPPAPPQGQSQDGGGVPVTPSLSRRTLASSSDTHGPPAGSPPPAHGLRTPSGWRAFVALHGGGGSGGSRGARGTAAASAAACLGAGGAGGESLGGSLEGGCALNGGAAGSDDSGCASLVAAAAASWRGSADGGDGASPAASPARGVLGQAVPLIDSPLAGAGPGGDAAPRSGSFSSASLSSAAPGGAPDCASLPPCGRQSGGRVSAHGAFPVSFSTVPRPGAPDATASTAGGPGGAAGGASCPSFDRSLLTGALLSVGGRNASVTSGSAPCTGALLAPLHDDPSLFNGLRVGGTQWGDLAGPATACCRAACQRPLPCPSIEPNLPPSQHRP